MPHKDPEVRREYKREQMRILRAKDVFDEPLDPNDPDNHPSVLYPNFGERYSDEFADVLNPRPTSWRPNPRSDGVGEGWRGVSRGRG